MSVNFPVKSVSKIKGTKPNTSDKYVYPYVNNLIIQYRINKNNYIVYTTYNLNLYHVVTVNTNSINLSHKQIMQRLRKQDFSLKTVIPIAKCFLLNLLQDATYKCIKCPIPS